MTKQNSRVILLAAIAAVPLLSPFSHVVNASPIGASDILVFQQNPIAGSTANGVPIAIVDVNPATKANQSFTANSLFTDSSGSEGSLALSNGGAQVSFSGFTAQTANEPTTTTARGAGAISASGTITYPASYTANSVAGGTQPRSAYSTDGTNYYFGDKTGIYINNGTAPLVSASGGTTPTNNTRPIKGFGGTTYALQASATTTNPFLVTLTPPGSTPGQTFVTQTGVPGLGNDNNALDFALVSSGRSGAGVYDTLYEVAAGKTGNNGIVKYGLVGGSFVAEGSDLVGGTAGTSDTLAGITAVNDPNGGVDLYVTNNLATGSVLEEITDSAAFNATIADSTPTVLYTAATGDLLKGVSTAPVTATTPEPATLGLATIAGLGLLKRKRNQG